MAVQPAGDRVSRRPWSGAFYGFALLDLRPHNAQHIAPPIQSEFLSGSGQDCLHGLTRPIHNTSERIPSQRHPIPFGTGPMIALSCKHNIPFLLYGQPCWHRRQFAGWLCGKDRCSHSGGPAICGVKGACRVFCLPGNPVAFMIVFAELAKPAILKAMRYRRVPQPLVRAILQRNV